MDERHRRDQRCPGCRGATEKRDQIAYIRAREDARRAEGRPSRIVGVHNSAKHDDKGRLPLPVPNNCLLAPSGEHLPLFKVSHRLQRPSDLRPKPVRARFPKCRWSSMSSRGSKLSGLTPGDHRTGRSTQTRLER